jgi:hypothetical protein
MHFEHEAQQHHFSYSKLSKQPKIFLKNNVFWDLKINIYRTIILPVVLYRSETWSHTLREECWLRVFENRVLRRIFGP